MGIFVQFLRLSNYKSFVGDVIVGPLKPFTVLVGSNALGKHDLMDAIEFVCSAAANDETNDENDAADADNAQQPPPSKRTRRQHRQASSDARRESSEVRRSSVLATIVQSPSNQTVLLKRTQIDRFNRQRHPATSTVSHTYEIDKVAVTVAAYADQLLRLNVRPACVPLVLEATALMQLFSGTAHQRLFHFERACGSAEFRQPTRALTTRMAAAEEERLRDRQHLAVLVRRWSAARRRATEYAQLEATVHRLHVDAVRWDLRALTLGIKKMTVEVRSTLHRLAKLDETLAQQERADRECRQHVDDASSSVVEANGQVAAVEHVEINLKAEQRRFELEQQQAVDRFIEDLVAGVEAPMESAQQVGGLVDENWWRNEDLENDRLLAELENATATAAALQPDHRTTEQQIQLERVKRTFNEQMERTCAAFNEAINKPVQLPRSSERDALERSYGELLTLCDAESDRLVAELRAQPHCTIRRAFDVLPEIEPTATAEMCRSALYELNSAVICDSAEAAAVVARIVHDNDVDNSGDDEANGVQWHGIQSLLVHVGDVSVDGEAAELPTVAGTRSLSDVMRESETAADIGVLRYVEMCMPTTLLCAERRRAQEIADEQHNGVRVVTDGDVVFGPCGDIVWKMTGSTVRPSSPARRAPVVHNVAASEFTFTLNAAGVRNGLPSAETHPSADAIGVLMAYAQGNWPMLIGVLSADDRVAVRAELLAVKQSLGADMQTNRRQLVELKRESEQWARRTSLRSIEQTPSILLRTRTECTAHLEHCHTRLAAQRNRLHTVLLHAQRKQIPIALRVGRLLDISADNPAAIDAIRVDFSAIEAQPDASTAAAADRRCTGVREELKAARAILKWRAADRSIVSIRAQLDEERVSVERQVKRDTRRVDSLRRMLHDTIEKRVARLRPFYRRMRRYLNEHYAAVHGGAAVETFLLPDALDTDDEVELAFDGGVQMDFRPPGRPIRPKAQLHAGDRLLAALAAQFAVYASAGQPFVFVVEMDHLLAGAPVADRKRAAEFLVAQSARMQVVICSERPELFKRCDDLLGVLYTVDFDSTVIREAI